MPPDRRPLPPEDLDGEALLEWERIVAELEARGTLDKADRALLTLYAQTWGQWHEAMRGVTKYGAVIRYPNKTTGPSPFYKVAKETAVILRGLLNDMGLTPASRAKLKAGEPAAPGDLEF
jgi:P27 family predicted phage terminase small subunit